MSKREYTGRCHCGNIRFSFFSAEITEGRRCNCSLCIRKGMVMSPKYIPPADFRLSNNTQEISTYLWNDRVVDNVFCKNCGIHTYFGSPEYGYRVNMGCVEQVDAYALEIKIIDGRSMAIAANPGPHPGN